jgi:hypothetical protein
VSNLRQAVGEPLHPQMLQIDPDYLRGETPTPGDRQIDRTRSYRRREVVGIGECSNGAR